MQTFVRLGVAWSGRECWSEDSPWAMCRCWLLMGGSNACLELVRSSPASPWVTRPGRSHGCSWAGASSRFQIRQQCPSPLILEQRVSEISFPHMSACTFPTGSLRPGGETTTAPVHSSNTGTGTRILDSSIFCRSGTSSPMQGCLALFQQQNYRQNPCRPQLVSFKSMRTFGLGEP